MRGGVCWLYSYTAMCVAVKFVLEGKTRTASPTVGAKLPILMRSGQVTWVEWGWPVKQQIASADAMIVWTNCGSSFGRFDDLFLRHN